MITRQEVRAFYDAMGRREDWWSIFGDPAVDELVQHGGFGDAHAVCELGCGTGRLAERLLRDRLPEDATYLGLDLSATMVRLARRRLRPWADRAIVVQADVAPHIPLADAAFDRVVATYVVEIFSDEEAAAVLAEAHRILDANGLICLTSLSLGRTPLSRFVCGLWNRVYVWSPARVGGCRPIALREVLPPGRWAVRHHAVTIRFGVPCETVIAARS